MPCEYAIFLDKVHISLTDILNNKIYISYIIQYMSYHNDMVIIIIFSTNH